MKTLLLMLTAAITVSGCHARRDSQQPDERALKAANADRARANAGQDAIQAQRQLNLVAERTTNGSQQKIAPDDGVRPKK
jgi:hypothetical protein